MPLYCYIIETGMYEDRQANILGHPTKYTHEEFDKLCIEITEKYGDVEEIEYFSAYDTTDVNQIRYNINPEDLIEHLVNEYGFVKLSIPVNDGVNYIEVSRTPVPPEKLRKVEIKRITCPFMEDMEITCNSPDSDFDTVYHPNARCEPSFFIKKEEKDQ